MGSRYIRIVRTQEEVFDALIRDSQNIAICWPGPNAPVYIIFHREDDTTAVYVAAAALELEFERPIGGWKTFSTCTNPVLVAQFLAGVFPGSKISRSPLFDEKYPAHLQTLEGKYNARLYAAMQ